LLSSPTPADIVLSYSYAVERNDFTITWRSSYTSYVAIDGVQAPSNGRRSYPLETHTYLLVATSLDETQRWIKPIAVVVNRCSVTVNGRTMSPAGTTCRTARPPVTAAPTEPTGLLLPVTPKAYPTIRA
jgi:hypothetical protein